MLVKDSTPLYRFLAWLLGRQPDLSQSEIGRKAGLSQSMINKVMRQRGTAWPDAKTFRGVAGAYWREWVLFLETHPDVQRQLDEEFAWARGALPPAGTAEAPSQELAEARQTLTDLFSSGDRARQGFILDMLRAAMKHTGVDQEGLVTKESGLTNRKHRTKFRARDRLRRHAV